MDNLKPTTAPPRGPRQPNSTSRRPGSGVPPWQQDQGRRQKGRSRSPRGNRYDERRRERSIEHDGPRNRDRLPQEQRLNQNDRSRQHRGGFRGGRGRRGSASSSGSDKPLYRQELDKADSRRQTAASSKKEPLKIDKTPLDSITDWEIDAEELKRVLGVTRFNTTKETKVPGNDRLYGVSKTKKSEYRQYMNRVGGFNRPLSPTRGNQFAKHADTSGVKS